MRDFALPVIAALTLLCPGVAAAGNVLAQSKRVWCAVTPNSSIAPDGEDAVVCQGLRPST